MNDTLHRLAALLGDGPYQVDTPAPPRRSWGRRALHFGALLAGWAAIAAVAWLGMLL